MKFALVFLSILVVFSDQQFYNHRPPTAAERHFWLSRYYSPPLPAFDDYDDQLVDYDDNQVDDGSFYLPLMPKRPVASSQNMGPYLNAIEQPNDTVEGEQFPDIQARRKIGNRFPSRIRPSFFQPKPPNDPRFVINLASSFNLFNRKVKTITFTFTSSLTFTSVQSCIPYDQFSYGLADVTCRRKRRGLVAYPDIKPEDSQFAITPSDVQPVEPTGLTFFDLTNENNRHWTTDRTFDHHQIVSSKEEDEVTSPTTKYSREKRLFFHLVTTATVISYSFLSTTVTKTVSLINTAVAPGIAYLICRPEGYTVCPYTNTFPVG